jgi:hypothetical protein
MKKIEHYFGIGQFVIYRLDKWIPHIHGYCLDLLALADAKLIKKAHSVRIGLYFLKM